MTDEQRQLVKAIVDKLDTRSKKVATTSCGENRRFWLCRKQQSRDLWHDLVADEMDTEKSLVQEYEMLIKETAVKENTYPLV